MTSLCRAALLVAEGSGLSAGSLARTRNFAAAGVIWSSNERAQDLEALQGKLGEGPSVIARSQGQPVLVPDIRDHWPRPWVFFGAEADALGVRSVWALPLRVGIAQVGVLTLHGQVPAPLDTELLNSQLRVCDALTGALLNDLPQEKVDLDPVHAVTQQAAGMVMVQLDRSIEDAFAALRSYAYGRDLTLHEVATLVVSRKVRFSPDDLQPSGDR